ncbi:MAG TPA: class I SAM-dependent methyltransferase [Dongiaceae bacterium]|nr:class I SAM-dependent methyltransferase [Dongiaceae bacterium]
MQRLNDLALAPEQYVPETRFGIWFLKTETWTKHVLERAINDLQRLIIAPRPSYPVIVDIGCGRGRSFKLLQQRFHPRQMIGIDIDSAMLDIARQTTAAEGLTVSFHQTTSWHTGLPDNSVDIVFCHQTFHHLVEQEAALKEFWRILRPGGLFLFAESTRKYIHSWIIRLLFRHPMDVQRTADEYLAMIRATGFDVSDASISLPYLWWSRSDLGILERWFGISPRRDREETLINLVAKKPE